MKENESKLFKSELQKLLDNTAKLRKKQVFEELNRGIESYRRNSENLKMLLILRTHVKSVKEFSLLQMAIFLWLFEGVYVNRLNEICLLLVENEHDLYNPLKQKYVSSMKEIKYTDLFSKPKFLESHKFKMLIRIKDQMLRNKIAHNDFELNEEGVILISGKTLDLPSKILDLQNFLIEITDITAECLEKTVDQLRQ